jgi:hypothetical protein
LSPRTLATIAALTSLILGGGGLVAPRLLASAFGISLDPTGIDLARLACASYVGYAALNWMARGVTDAPARRAIAAGNAIGWAAGCLATMLGVLSGLDERVWLLVAIAMAFTAAWSLATLDMGRQAEQASGSVA